MGAKRVNEGWKVGGQENIGKGLKKASRTGARDMIADTLHCKIVQHSYITASSYRNEKTHQHAGNQDTDPRAGSSQHDQAPAMEAETGSRG